MSNNVIALTSSFVLILAALAGGHSLIIRLLVAVHHRQSDRLKAWLPLARGLGLVLLLIHVALEVIRVSQDFPTLGPVWPDMSRIPPLAAVFLMVLAFENTLSFFIERARHFSAS